MYQMSYTIKYTRCLVHKIFRMLGLGKGGLVQKNGSGDPKKKFQVLGLNCLKQ